MSRSFVASTVVLALACTIVVASNHVDYDRYCDVMIRFAQQTATAHNQGDADAAREFSNSLYSAYESAVKLFPNEPQAHLNMAVFLSNSHKYDEAINKFELARKLIGKNSQADMQISLGIRRAKFQKYSKLRDEAYEQGQGDLKTTHEWALKQLSVTTDLHIINHDVGTIEVMLCEYNESWCNKSVTRFKGAAYTVQGHYMQSRMPEGKQRMACLHSKLCIGNFSQLSSFVSINEAAMVPSVFFNSIRDGVTIHGSDGVLTFDDPGHCSVATTTPDYYTNFARSLPVRSPNGAPPPPEGPPTTRFPEGSKVLLLTQFSGAAFYHWMCEAVPRLLVARKALPGFSEYSILIPSLVSGAPLFITETFLSLFPDINNELHEHRDVSYNAGESVAITWEPQPCPHQSPESGKTAQLIHCTSLTQPSALTLARDEIVKVLPVPDSSTTPYVLVAGRGGHTSMRNFDVEKLVRDVEVSLGAAYKVQVFDGSKQSLIESLALFRGASLVVGVHGGALANIMGCTESTRLVEIGFSTIGAQQYQHVARALGMPYRRVYIKADSLQRALSAPTVEYEAEKLGDAIRQLLSPAVESDEL